MSGGPGPGVGFELTVLGGLGPVLEASLAPCLSFGLHATTVLRVRRDHADLVETYGDLVRGGFEVTDITQSTERGRSAAGAQQRGERGVRR